jgi:hypothetical protein
MPLLGRRREKWRGRVRVQGPAWWLEKGGGTNQVVGSTMVEIMERAEGLCSRNAFLDHGLRRMVK